MVNIDPSNIKTKLLFNDGAINMLDRPFGRVQIEKLIPHRDPFVLVDSVELINTDLRIIQTSRRVDPCDSVFQGHFPGNPIYPGVLQQEAMFQSALILMYFLLNNTCIPPEVESITHAVGTRIYDVYHMQAVHPGDVMTMKCWIEDFDSYLATAQVQVVVNNKIVTAGKGEFCVL